MNELFINWIDKLWIVNYVYIDKIVIVYELE